MRKLFLSVVGASALAIASAASAQTIINPGAPLTPGSDLKTTFIVSTPGDVPVTPTYTGPITATIGHSGISAGDFYDQFRFTIGMDGMGLIGAGSGSVTTSATIFLGIDDLDITEVIFNNGVTDFLANLVLKDNTGAVCTTRGGANECGILEEWGLTGVPIIGGELNTLNIRGTSHGTASYGGTLTFTPNAAVPEPATWGMMLLGFAGIGWQLRRQRRSGAIAQLA